MEHRERLNDAGRVDIDKIDAMETSLKDMLEEHGRLKLRFWKRLKETLHIPPEAYCTITADRTEVFWEE